jgi:nitrogen fixation protein FixH
MTAISTRPASVHSRRDAWIPWLFVAFFLLVFAANGVMLLIAFGSWTGVSDHDAYQRGLAYNEEIEAARAQEALGWQGDLVFGEGETHGARVEFTLRDAARDPLDGAVVRARVMRPTHQGYDFDVAFRPRGDGRYVAELELPLPGQWEVRVTAEHPRGSYRLVERVLVP